MDSWYHQTLRQHDAAGLNRRMRKTACPVVWEGPVISPAPTRSWLAAAFLPGSCCRLGLPRPNGNCRQDGLSVPGQTSKRHYPTYGYDTHNRLTKIEHKDAE